MKNFRSFPPATEQIAIDWRSQSVTILNWQGQAISHQAGEASGFFVTCGSLSGYAKPGKNQPPVAQHCRAAHEKIASDLAFELGLPVPPAILWIRSAVPSGCEQYCCVSALPFVNANPWREARKIPGVMNRLLPQIGTYASAIAAFDTWVGNTDRANEGNLLVTEDVSEVPAILRVAYIDYANSLTFGWNDAVSAETVRAVAHYPSEAPCDESAMAEAIDRIEALPDDRIQAIVARVDHTFVPSPKRAIIETALMDRKAKIRSALKSMYSALP